MPNGITIRPLSVLTQAASALYVPPPDTIRGVENNNWFGPGQPVKPIAPEGTQPRGLQYSPFQNLIYTPRPDRIPALELMKLSRFEMARVLIENVKDQITRQNWQIRPRPISGETKKETSERAKGDNTIKTLSRFFERPNPDEDWSEFIRKPLEDMLVLDAPSILLRRSKKKQIVELRSVQGDTITRYIDVNGFTPQPPSPAYAQLWYGLPMLDLTTDDLVYKPRNILPSQLYGYSPTEQSYDWIVTAMYRLQSQKQAYESGTIPDAIQIVPPDISADDIREAQMWMVSDLAGNLAKRHQLRYLAGFSKEGKDQVLFPKKDLLTDAFDDFLIRVLCFAFGTSPQRLLKMQNRATATANQDAAEDEGLEPWKNWVAGTTNYIIQRKMGYEDYEFAFSASIESDQLKQAQADATDLKSGKKTWNGVREDSGLDPYTFPEADEPIAQTANGFIPFSVGLQGAINGLSSGSGDDRSGTQASPGKGKDGKQQPGAGANSGTTNGNGKQPKGGSGKPNGSTKLYTNGHSSDHCSVHNQFTSGCISCLTKAFPVQDAATALRKYSEDQERDERGRFGSGGGGSEIEHEAMSTSSLGDPSDMSEKDLKEALSNAQDKGDKAEQEKYQNELDRRGYGGKIPFAAAHRNNGFRKDKRISIDPGYSSPKLVQAKSALQSGVEKVFRRQRDRASHKAGELAKLGKAKDDKEEISSPEAMADGIYAEVEPEWIQLPGSVRESLGDAYKVGVDKGIAELSIADSNLISSVNRGAADWASDRAAEMVGMKWDEEGSLIPNPNAEMRIDDTTRESIRGIVKDAFEDETKMSTLANDIANAGSFSDARAEMIARTEVSFAQVNGNYSVWQESGLVEAVQWNMSEDHEETGCDCEMNDSEVVPIGEPFPSGDDMPPAHPSCWCVVSSASLADMEASDAEE